MLKIPRRTFLLGSSSTVATSLLTSCDTNSDGRVSYEEVIETTDIVLLLGQAVAAGVAIFIPQAVAAAMSGLAASTALRAFLSDVDTGNNITKHLKAFDRYIYGQNAAPRPIIEFQNCSEQDFSSPVLEIKDLNSEKVEIEGYLNQLWGCRSDFIGTGSLCIKLPKLTAKGAKLCTIYLQNGSHSSYPFFVDDPNEVRRVEFELKALGKEVKRMAVEAGLSESCAQFVRRT